MRKSPHFTLSGKLFGYGFFISSLFFANNSTALANPQGTPYSQATLFELLGANFSLYRQDQMAALTYFLSLAKRHKTAYFAALAAQLALSQNKHKALLEATIIWLDAAPYEGKAYYFSALAMAHNNRPFTALAYMREAELHQHPTDYTRLVTLAGEDRRTQNDYITRLAFARAPSYSNYDAIIALCLLLAAQNRFEPVPALLKNALKYGQDIPMVFDYASQVYLSLQQPEKALKLYEKGVILHPSSLGLRMKLAILAQTIAPELAQIQFEILQFHMPNNILVKKKLGDIYINSGDLQKAQTVFLTLLEQPEASLFAKEKLARIATLENKPASALTYLASIPKKTRTPAIQRHLIQTHIQLHNWHQAQRLIKSSLKQRLNTHDQVQLKLLNITRLIAEGKNKQALKTLRRYHSEHPENDELFLSSATLAATTLDNASFIRHIEKLLGSQTDRSHSLKKLGIHIASQTLAHTKIQSILQNLLSLAPNNPVLLDTYGWLLYRIDYLDDARAWVARAFALQPSTQTGTHLGEILWLLGDKKAARRIFNEAARMTPDDEELHNTIERLHVTLSPSTTT